MRQRTLIGGMLVAIVLASGSAFGQSGDAPGGMTQKGSGMHGGAEMHGSVRHRMHGGMGHGMHGTGGRHDMHGGGHGMHGGMGQGGHDGSQGPSNEPGSRARHDHGDPNASGKRHKDAATLALQAVNAQMHDAMKIAYIENPDVDFAKSMIPHHQGAIDMAKVLLVFGKSPELRKLAEDIIKAQEQEIAWMRDWLKKNGHL